MRLCPRVLSSLIVALAPAWPLASFAAVGFYASSTLSDGTTVRVARPTQKSIELVVNFEPFPTRTSSDPGCGVWLTRHEAEDLGDLYLWAASDEAPQQFEEVVELASGGEVTVSRGAVNVNMESVLDDGTNLIGISYDCIPSMSDADAIMVGNWLLTAAANH